SRREPRLPQLRPAPLGSPRAQEAAQPPRGGEPDAQGRAVLRGRDDRGPGAGGREAARLRLSALTLARTPRAHRPAARPSRVLLRSRTRWTKLSSRAGRSG